MAWGAVSRGHYIPRPRSKKLQRKGMERSTITSKHARAVRQK
ncbi:MAG: hypothetical protein UV60_C0026G0006 [Parcubacteria group bacterium GW2011_GWA2_43_11]|nr:MAG: hypothetical protein UV60_C0026G0006 [Parcubacteria group bacterium GW2011_GWA2_43_11]